MTFPEFLALDHDRCDYRVELSTEVHDGRLVYRVDVYENFVMSQQVSDPEPMTFIKYGEMK